MASEVNHLRSPHVLAPAYVLMGVSTTPRPDDRACLAELLADGKARHDELWAAKDLMAHARRPTRALPPDAAALAERVRQDGFFRTLGLVLAKGGA